MASLAYGLSSRWLGDGIFFYPSVRQTCRAKKEPYFGLLNYENIYSVYKLTPVDDPLLIASFPEITA